MKSDRAKKPTVKQALTTGERTLRQHRCPGTNAQLEASELLAAATGRTRVQLLTRPEQVLTPSQNKKYTNLIARRRRHEPLAYLLGHAGFFGLDFIVTPATLIPRPATEHLVEAALDRLQAWPSATVIDVGTGSGTIAVAIAQARPQTTVYGSDLSSAALAIARRNASRLLKNKTNLSYREAGPGEARPIELAERFRSSLRQCPPRPRVARFLGIPTAHSVSEHRRGENRDRTRGRLLLDCQNTPNSSPTTIPNIKFKKGDLLHPWWHHLTPDRPLIITANLPYIPTKDWPKLSLDIRRHEPKTALVAGPDGLAHYRRLIDQLALVARTAIPGETSAGRRRPGTQNKKITLILELLPKQFRPLTALIRRHWPKAKIDRIKNPANVTVGLTAEL